MHIPCAGNTSIMNSEAVQNDQSEKKKKRKRRKHRKTPNQTNQGINTKQYWLINTLFV